MIDGEGIQGVDFIVCNTDAQSLQESKVPNKIQLGLTLTEGLGAGTDPEQGEKAALESEDQIRQVLGQDTKQTNMVFITAGMGGGTGTGAAPVIARIAKEMGILTIAIVTRPFRFEGTLKDKQALKGIEQLEACCDTVLVILNDRLTELYKHNKKSEAFAEADNVLKKAAKSIAEVITVPGKVNVDFMDVRMVLKDAGQALMGAAEAEGEDRAERAIREALNSPLLDNHKIQGAKRLLFTMAYSREHEITLAEQETITDFIEQEIGSVAPIAKNGDIFDDSLGKKLRITIIAAGFDKRESFGAKASQQNPHATPSPNGSTQAQPNGQAAYHNSGGHYVYNSNWLQGDAYLRAATLQEALLNTDQLINPSDFKQPAYSRNKITLIDLAKISEEELVRVPFEQNKH